MSPTLAGTTRVRFGLFEADFKTGELWKAGHHVKLQSQPFKVLATLVERPGEIVTREELQARLWGQDTVVEFEHSLGTAINRIREALGDSAANPRFIETLTRRGYRFIAPVTQVARVASVSALSFELPREIKAKDEQKGTSAAALPPATSVAPSRPAHKMRHLYIASAFAICVVIGILLGRFWGSWMVESSAALRISPVTETGNLSPGTLSMEDLPAAATDGVDIFASVIENGQAVLSRIAIGGDDVQPLQLPSDIASPSLADISPDGTELLVRSHLPSESARHLWIVPIHGGSAFRVSNVLADDATWMPDGKGILYSLGNQLTTLRLYDGASTHFASLPFGRAYWLRWSPDHRLLRFTVIDPVSHSSSLWEISAGSTTPRRVVKDWNALANECCGTWTSDGQFFIFQATRDGSTDIWRTGGLSTSNLEKITNGPLSYRAPVADRSGHRVFFLGVDSRSELYSYDAGHQEFLVKSDFLSGATRLNFSRDRQWVAWIDYRQRLWRARVDGGERIQLTPDFLQVFLATWSPDGHRLAVMAREPGKPWQIYLIGFNGGNAEPLLQEHRNAADPSWSADGRYLVFGRVDDVMGKENGPRMLEVIDLSTGHIVPLPHSEGLFSPRWSPNGLYISAITLDQQNLMLYDVAAHTWTTLANTSVADPVWSADSRSIYFQALMAEFQPLYRVNVPDGNLEQITNLKAFRSGNPGNYFFCGITPDNVPLVRVHIHSGDLYTTDLDGK